MKYYFIYRYFILLYSAENRPEVDTEHGVIRGIVADLPDQDLSVEEFRGIPYAQPPIGVKRFTNPSMYGRFQGRYLQRKVYR